MKSKFGVTLIVLGCVMITAALGLFLYNMAEQNQAAEASAAVMPQLVETIQQRQKQPQQGTFVAAETVPESPELVNIPVREMPVVEIDGYGYIGFISIPSIGLELPVMADWSYKQLNIAPCRFFGDSNSSDLVIMAHNYAWHFGKLNKLQNGDSVYFTDMDGITLEYAVCAQDVLDPMAAEEMTSGAYDLTLFTCTYGGKSRVTIRCDEA